MEEKSETRIEDLLAHILAMHKVTRDLLSAVNSGMIGSEDGEKVIRETRIALIEFELFILKGPTPPKEET